MELFVNPLSVNKQCKTLEECELVVKNFNDCINFFSNAIKSRNVRVFLDEHVFLSSFFASQAFDKTIGNISPDEQRRWFIYKNNYSYMLSVENPEDSILVSVLLENSPALNGNVHKHLVGAERKWLSFSGNPFDQHILNVKHINTEVVKNYHTVDQLKNLFPMYEANPKHRKEPYTSASGEFVSAMPISDVHAQELLFAAKGLVWDGDKWAYCSISMEYYRFKRTYPDRPVYHGFVCLIADVPDMVLTMLKE